MPKGLNIFGIIADVVNAVLLFIYAILIGPLGILRGPLAFDRAFSYFWVLAPQGLVADSVRAAIFWRLGRFDSAIAKWEAIVGSCEEHFEKKPNSRARRQVLEDLYTILARCYLHAGHIDDAMLVVIRAKKCLTIERLSNMAELDAKTAHLVRAGLAAGRLLDGNGLATMFVKSNKTAADDGKKLQGATGKDNKEGKDKPKAGAQIIQFPNNDLNL